MSAVPLSLGLTKAVRAYYRLKPQRQRSAGFHPSEIAREEFCPVLKFFEQEADAKVVSDDPRSIQEGFNFKRTLLKMKADQFSDMLPSEFVIGHAIHDLVQFEFGAIGVLHGIWECPACGAQTLPGQMPRTQVEDRSGQPMLDAAPCRACNGQNYRSQIPWRYIEPAVGWRDAVRHLNISGHMDGDLRYLIDGKIHRYVLEIKSINQWGYGEGKQPRWEDQALGDGWQPPAGWQPALSSTYRKLPLANHVTQASLYAACEGITHIVFVYVNKNQIRNRKEFVVPLDPSVIHLASGKIQAVTEAQQRQIGPPLHARVCHDVRDDIARKCPAVERCFGCKPPQNFWETRK